MKTEISKVIKDNNFRDLMTNINEVVLDSFLENGIIKVYQF